MVKDSVNGFGLLSIVLHWVSTLLILGLFALGLYMTGLSYYDTWYHQGPWWHVSFGLLLMFITGLRLLWRTVNPRPAPVTAQQSLNRLATAIKYLLYVALVAVLLSGYFMNTAEGRAASFFDWFGVPALLGFDANGVDWLGRIHLWGAWFLIGLAAIHAGAALVHHFWWRDRTLMRILRPAQDRIDSR